MKKVVLTLLVVFGLIVTQANACEVCVNGLNTSQVLTKSGDTIPPDGKYEIDARYPFVVTITNGKIVSFVDTKENVELVSQLVSLKFFTQANEDAGTDDYHAWARQHKYPMVEMARMRKLGTEEWTYWAVIIGNMKRVWQMPK